MQCVVDRCHKLWDALKREPTKAWSNPYEFQEYISRCLRSFSTLLYEWVQVYDSPANLTDVEREEGIHKLCITFTATKSTHRFYMTVRSDRPRTSVALSSDATGDLGDDVNVFEPVFAEDVETEEQS